MSQSDKYLIIAAFAPSHDPAAATAMAIANALSQNGSITCVIDDLSADMPHTSNLTVIRRSAFEHNLVDYQQHKRIYCLGNSFESLFVLELLHLYPGVVVTHDGSYHDLILSFFQSQKLWPENYTNWLTRTLGDNGRTISNALLQHRRLSKSLGSEVLDRTPMGLDKYRQIVLAKDSLFPYAARVTPSDSEHAEPSTVLCINMPAETIDAANSDLENLGKAIRLQSCHAGNPSLAEHIGKASIIVLGSAGVPSPALSYSLQLGKAIIVAGQAWSGLLPGECHLRIDNAYARHQLIAAIGAISLDPALKSSLENAAQKQWSQDTQNTKLDELIRLTEQQATLALATQVKKKKPTPSNKISHTKTAPVSDILLDEKASVPTALIGSVPATHLVQKILPGIDPHSSPRFATPALASALSIFDHGDIHSLLANLGFETPVINIEHDTERNTQKDIKHLYDWPDVRSGLRNSDHVVAFNAQITNVPAVQHMDTNLLLDRYGTEMTFSDSLSPFLKQKAVPLLDRVMGHLDGPGLFWELDKAKCCVKCIMIVGITGRYTLQNLSKVSSIAFIISNNDETSELGNNSITLKANEEGVLNFSVRAIDINTRATLDSMFLLKSLAEVHLKLGWSSHE
ncbi:hypothetical protein [Kordiimonas aquimaris]|uniref:hypothetical protein n=1 Tax=Kordiimonas aquimaris TaxID=707591 RepID=UPI0021D362DF|nr:hypothetical protein [Kordiimonas aquimaris]